MPQKIAELSIRDIFAETILKNPIPELATQSQKRQEEIVCSRVRMSILHADIISFTQDGRVQVELGSQHLNNSYISTLPLRVIKSTFALIAAEANISNSDIEAVMITKQTGVLRDKIIAYLPNQAFADRLRYCILE